MSDPEPPAEAGPGRPRPPAWEAGAVGAALVLTLGGLAWWAARTPEPGGPPPASYVGERACRECHPGPSAAYARSGHARTLRRVEATSFPRRLDGVEVADPERPGAVWSYAARGGRLTTTRREAGDVERFVIEYAFGSGRHATTFVTLTDRDPARPKALEHRMSLFSHKDLPDVTPGQSLRGHAGGNTPSGRYHSAGDTLRCFECHATVTSRRAGRALDESTMVPNVTCERCHGPGGDHVAAARRGGAGGRLAMPLGPGRAPPAALLRACGECHRLPEMIAGGAAAIRPDNPSLVRHQPVGMMQSACYTGSRGALSCTTCHDPHARASTDRAAYEAVCLSCHRGPGKAACPVSPASGCLDCHMPRREVTRGMVMTDHWIRTPPAPPPPR